jgi:LysM repeat protein
MACDINMRYKNPKNFSLTENTVTIATVLKNRLKPRPLKTISTLIILFGKILKYNSSMKKILYRVCQGDTLMGVARRFGVPVSLIVSDNNLKSPIRAGQMLVINVCDGCLYTVKPTDTLLGLSKRFNQPIEEIKSRNKLEYLFYGISIWV